MRRSLELSARILVSAGLLALIATKIPLEAFRKSLAEVDLLPMLVSYLFIPLMGYIDANRTKVMTDLQGLTLSVGAICRIGFITSFYSLFLPGHLAGGVVRWHRLQRQDKKPAEAFAIILFGRTLSTIVGVAIGLACWALDPLARQRPIYGWLLAGLLVGLLGLYTVLFTSGRARAIARWLFIGPWVPQFAAGKLEKVLASAAKFEHLSGRRLAPTIALMVTSELLGVVSFYLVSIAVHMDLSLISVGWTRAYVNIVTLIPVSMLGMGVREGSLIVMLRTYGIAPALALSYSVLLLTRTIVLGLLGGCCEAWNILRAKGGLIPGRAP